MKWMAKATVGVTMLISIPTAGCQVAHNWGPDANHAAKSREETTTRGETFTTALPQNVDRSLERDVRNMQVAQSTIRSDENVRSGGSSVGGGSAPPPPTTSGGK
jgi:hypothetical protein